MSKEKILEKFSAKLGNEDFVSPSTLVEIGIFGSSTAVHSALRKGVIPGMRISTRRTLIPKESVLEYLMKSFAS